MQIMEYPKVAARLSYMKLPFSVVSFLPVAHVLLQCSQEETVIWNQQHKGYKSKPATY